MFGLISKESNDQDRVDIGYSRVVRRRVVQFVQEIGFHESTLEGDSENCNKLFATQQYFSSF